MQKVLSERKFRLTADVQGKGPVTQYPFKVVGTHSFLDFVSVPITKPTPAVVNPGSFVPSLTRSQDRRKLATSKSFGNDVFADEELSDVKFRDVTAVPYAVPGPIQESTTKPSVVTGSPGIAQTSTPAVTSTPGGFQLPPTTPITTSSNPGPIYTQPPEVTESPGFSVEPPGKVSTSLEPQTSFKTDFVSPLASEVPTVPSPTANGYNILPPIAPVITTAESIATRSIGPTETPFPTSLSSPVVSTTAVPVATVTQPIATPSFLPPVPSVVSTTSTTPPSNPYAAPIGPSPTTGLLLSTGRSEDPTTLVVTKKEVVPSTEPSIAITAITKPQPLAPGYLLDHPGHVELIQPVLTPVDTRQPQVPPEPLPLVIYGKTTKLPQP